VTPTRPGPRRTARIVALVGLLAALAALWLLARPLGEVARTRRQFAELQQQVALARESAAARAADRNRVMRLRAQARASSGAQRDTYEAEASAIDARAGWGNRAMVRAAVLAAPIVNFRRTVRVSGVTPAYAPDGPGCVACHLAIATAGYEKYPAPFRTHPMLASSVGADSPHPPSRVGCTSCHQGDAHGTSFAAAGHSRLAADARAWVDPAAPHAMLPVGRVEAGCVSCHAGERYQPGAQALNDGLTTLQRGGCYACHDVPGMERVPKRGPDLRRVASKLTEPWVRTWLANPRAVKPATWMPRFWTDAPSSPDDAAAIDAVTAYLFASSERFVPVLAHPPQGDPARGRAIVESVGCLGCHVVGDASRDETSLRRTFGQPLEGIGGKTSYAWIVDWVTDPSHYRPDTSMPNLRLDAREAADVATYLATLRGDGSSASGSGTPPGIDAGSQSAGAMPPLPDDAYRRVMARYGNRAAPAGGSAARTGPELRTEAGRVVIEAVGCFNCHEIGGFEGRRIAVPMGSRPVWRDTDARAVHAAARDRQGTAAGDRASVQPIFDLGTAESARLALALTAVAGRVRNAHAMSMPWHLAKAAGRTLVQERNCVGCHAIEETGGDFVKLVAEPSLGPPLLTPEGSRVQPEWLRRFLRQPSTIRPWLAVRMPTFGWSDEELDAAHAYFVAIAAPNERPAGAPVGAAAAAGRELFELLKCQQCHVLGSIPPDQPTANLAPDLRLSHERLQPDWILAWLRHPSAILPGTRMPTFWPDYPQSFYEPLNHDGAAQIRAIRDYLLTLH
jgi:cytochrome c2